MFKPTGLKMMCLGACLVFVLLVVNPGFSQEKTQDLEKKYAAIIGDYEFDLTDMGMDTITVSFYVEGDALWAWPSTASSAAEMEPVEGKEFEFVVDDPDEGTYEVKFLKDESGQYTKCRVINDMMGMDVTGEKIENE